LHGAVLAQRLGHCLPIRLCARWGGREDGGDKACEKLHPHDMSPVSPPPLASSVILRIESILPYPSEDRRIRVLVDELDILTLIPHCVAQFIKTIRDTEIVLAYSSFSGGFLSQTHAVDGPVGLVAIAEWASSLNTLPMKALRISAPLSLRQASSAEGER
jgi:hypothetical protein